MTFETKEFKKYILIWGGLKEGEHIVPVPGFVAQNKFGYAFVLIFSPN